MLCWSCGKEISDDAIRCRHCEAMVEDKPTQGDMTFVGKILDGMDPELVSEIRNIFQASKSGEDFVNQIMVGDCLKCGSSNTGNCESDPEIDDITIGRCFDCGQLWCSDCGELLSEEKPFCRECEQEMAFDDNPQLERHHLMAAEIFRYSFANYLAHLGIGHMRFEKLMPDDAKLLERAYRQKWPVAKIAKALSTDEDNAKNLLRECEKAIEVVDAENAAESFRNAVRFVVKTAVEEGLDDENSIENLVTQICYRVSDLSVLLDMESRPLSHYSEDMRREPDVKYDE